MVAKCIAAGLVGGEGFSIDASLIKADVDKKKRVPGDQPVAWPKAEEASRAVREYQDDGGEFIGVFFETEFDFNSCLKPNDISNLVNNCLADIPLG